MPHRRPIAFSFRLKLLLAVGLVAVADLLFWMQAPGWTVGGFSLLCTGAVAATQPAAWRNTVGAGCLVFSALMGLLLVDAPDLLPWCLAALSLTAAALTPRRLRNGGIASWVSRLVWHGFVSLAGPILDLLALRKARRGGVFRRLPRLVPLLALPVVGAGAFLILFSAANPLIARAFANLRAPELDIEAVVRLLYWTVVFWAVWTVLRPRRLPRRLEPADRAALPLPTPSSASLTLSLAVFNAIFAVENGLDIAFLWSGAPLPQGMTLADYAHRGAYPLIVTALLAGAFVLVALRPGSPTAKRPLIRWLLIAWVVQNVFLVASCVLRTVDYIEAYSLTRMRIAALAWMALVAIGLVLILWRMLAGRSTRWLVWANLAAVLTALVAGSAADIGRVAADWNVRHAREISGHGASLDWDYLRELGPAAIPALAWLERHAPAPPDRFQARTLRTDVQPLVLRSQSHWRSWTGRNARRLAAAGPAPAPPRPARLTPAPTGGS